MSMEAKIRVPNFKNVLKVLKGIGEEAILVFDEDGLSVRMVDGEKTKMVRVRISEDGFTTYVCDRHYEMAVVLVRLDDIVKALTTKDELRFRIVDHDDGTMRFSLLANGMERGIKLLNLRLMEGHRAPPWPTFDYVFSAIVPSDEVRSFLKAASISNDFRVEVEPDSSGNGMCWSIADEREPLSWKPTDCKVSSNSHAISLYSVENISKAVAATVGKQELSIRGGTDIPIEFSWSPHEGISMATLVAHRGTS